MQLKSASGGGSIVEMIARVSLAAAALLIVAQPTMARAARNVWTLTGPPGGAITAVAVHPLDPDTVYASTQSGTFASRDGGTTWRQLRRRASNAIAIAPSNRMIVYADNAGTIVRSSDGGITWGEPHEFGDRSLVVALAVDAEDPDTVYAADAYYFAASRDGGVTWTIASVPDEFTGPLALPERRPGTVYAASVHGVYKSVDYGRRWTLSRFPSELNVWTLAVDGDGDRVYAGGNEGLLRSDDGGETWAAAATGLPPGSVTSLAVDRTSSEIVYAGTTRGLYRSTDRGDNWQATGLSTYRVRPLAIAGRSMATLYAALGAAGLWRTDDDGMSWRSVSDGLGAASVLLAFDAAGTLYAASDGVFRSTDAGLTWTSSAQGLPASTVESLAVHPSLPGTLYVGTCAGVYISSDGGETWRPTGLTFDPDRYSFSDCVRALAIDTLDPRTLYAGTYTGLFKSNDAGRTWARDRQLGSVGTALIVSDPRTAGVVYVAPDSARSPRRCLLYKSIDAGAHWRCLRRPRLAVTALAIDPNVPTTLYGALEDPDYSRDAIEGVYKSLDGGRTWTPTALTDTYERISALAIDPLHPSTVLAAASRYVYRSDDRGETWRPFTAGIDVDRFSSVRNFAFSSARPGTTYAGTWFGAYEIERAERCHGDCGGDGAVQSDDLTRGLAIAFGGADLATCSTYDRDASGRVEVAELIAAVHDATMGCAVAADPAYRLKPELPLETVPTSLFARDFDGDALVDVLTVDDHTVMLRHGHGDGTFSAGFRYSRADTINAAEIDDVDGDGHLDLVLRTLPRDSGIEQIIVLGNDGRGRFSDRSQLAADFSSLAVGDVNGDGKADLVTGPYGGDFAVRLGTADGKFGEPRSVHVGSPDDCVDLTGVADVNGDGIADIVLTSGILFGSRDGTLGPVSPGGTSGGIFADLDGDGFVDSLWASGWGDYPFFANRGTGDGSFGPGYAFAAGGTCRSALADLNGDGAPDLVCGNVPRDYYNAPVVSRISTILNLGNGVFTSPESFPTRHVPRVVATADVNGDGALDIIAAGECGEGSAPPCEGAPPRALSVWLARP